MPIAPTHKYMTDHCPKDKILDRQKAENPNTQIHDRSLFNGQDRRQRKDRYPKHTNT